MRTEEEERLFLGLGTKKEEFNRKLKNYLLFFCGWFVIGLAVCFLNGSFIDGVIKYIGASLFWAVVLFGMYLIVRSTS